MMFDKENCFSWKQDLGTAGTTGAVGTHRSTNVIDLGAPGTIYAPPLKGSNPTAEIDLGKGRPIEVLILINETFTSGGAATLQVILSAGTGTDGTDINAGEVTLFDSTALALATLVAGYRFGARVFVSTKLRYIQTRYVIGAFDMTAGEISAGIVDNTQTNMIGL